jgi:hypothetical protein
MEYLMLILILQLGLKILVLHGNIVKVDCEIVIIIVSWLKKYCCKFRCIEFNIASSHQILKNIIPSQIEGNQILCIFYMGIY